jgi:hypothetical protein
MKTAWFDDEILPDAMLTAQFKKLEESEHFNSLSSCFSKIENCRSIIDLGCGAAEIGRVFCQFDYTGADLPHIIDKVSKIKNPKNNYIKFDVEKDSLEFLKKYDVVVMNSFISEIPNWYLALSKVLLNAGGYIILHRQSVTNDKTSLFEYNTYGDLKTINNVINYKDLNNLFEMNSFEKIFETKSFDTSDEKMTFLFRKKDDKDLF